MSPRICIPLYLRWPNRNCSLKFLHRHCSPRYLLCSCPLSLCSKNRSGICYLCRIPSLFSLNNRTNNTTSMIKRSILIYIPRRKSYVLSSTLYRPCWLPPSILRLPRYLYYMKCNLIRWINTIIYCSALLHLHSLRSIPLSTTTSFYTINTYSSRMSKPLFPIRSP